MGRTTEASEGVFHRCEPSLVGTRGADDSDDPAMHGVCPPRPVVARAQGRGTGWPTWARNGAPLCIRMPRLAAPSARWIVSGDGHPASVWAYAMRVWSCIGGANAWRVLPIITLRPGPA